MQVGRGRPSSSQRASPTIKTWATTLTGRRMLEFHPWMLSPPRSAPGLSPAARAACPQYGRLQLGATDFGGYMAGRAVDARRLVRYCSIAFGMKTRFVWEGLERLERASEWQARAEASDKAVRARYAKALAEARGFRWCWLYWQMRRECGRERERIGPSSQALYSTQIIPARAKPPKRPRGLITRFLSTRPCSR